MKLRTICMILAFVMIVSMLAVSCGGGEENSAAPAASQGGNDSTPEVSVEPSEEVSQALVPGLDPAGLNLDGMTFKVLAMNNGYLYQIDQIIGYYRPNGDEELEDDPVKTAIQNRNNAILDEYGVTIEVEAQSGFDDFVRRIKEDFYNDTGDYQAFCGGANFLAPLTVEGYTLDFYGMENSYLRLDEQWWDPVTQAQMSVGHHLFMLCGDILLTDDENTKCIFFNKDIVDNYTGQDPAFDKHPYQLVRDNEWTLDAMYEMMKVASVDGDNGKMDYEGEDTWGLVGVSFDTYMLIMGGGHAQIKKDADDLPVFAMADSENVDTFLKVFDIVTDKDRTLFVEDYFRWDDSAGGVVRGHFYKGKALFMTGGILDVNGDSLRNADIHYGILPMPKYNIEQENYSSTVNPYHFGILCVPAFIQQSEIPEISFVLEAMAYLSKQDVTREYYDRTLKLKRFQDDDDSAEILDIIFRNRLVDISVIFNWDDCIQYYNRLRSANDSGIAHFCEQERDQFNAAMEETIANFAALDE